MNNMSDIKHRWGSSFDLAVELGDNATTVDLYLRKVGEPSFILATGTFIDGTANLNATPQEMELPLGDYGYQINVNYASGAIEKYPEAGCNDCDLPTLTICDAADYVEGASS